ncbi:MAG: DNA polymerase [Desulfobacterales bacterium]
MAENQYAHLVKILIEISKYHIITGKLEKIEKAVEPIIAQLNQTGLPLDFDVVENIRNQYLAEQRESAEQIFQVAGFEFDIGKRDQVETALKNEGFWTGKRTNKIVLDKLTRKGSNLAALIKRYRQLQRIASNGQSLFKYCDRFSRRLRPVSHQNKALTGRILSEGPCISNMSKPYRAAVCETGYQFVYFDFRNFELRIQASLAEDPVLIEMFNSGFDLHRFTAGLILDKEPSAVTDAERQQYKSISLGYWYGMGAEGIVTRTGLPKNLVNNITNALDRKFYVLRSRVCEKEKKHYSRRSETWRRQLLIGRPSYGWQTILKISWNAYAAGRTHWRCSNGKRFFVWWLKRSLYMRIPSESGI